MRQYVNLFALASGSLLLSLFVVELFFRYYDPFAVAVVQPQGEVVEARERNSLGLRDTEYPFETSRFRIVALGDSFTYGHGLKNESSWPKLLQHVLHESRSNEIEVLNAGRPGTNTAWQYRYLERKVMQYNPDLVLLGFLINDCTRHCSNCGAVKMKKRFDGMVEETRDSSLSALWRVIRLTSLRRELTKKTVERFAKPYREELPSYQRCMQAFSQFQALSEKESFRFVVFIYPMLFQLEESYPFQEIHSKILTELNGLGIEGYDMTEVFLGEKDTDLWLHASDSHPNREANLLAARYIAQVLERRNMIDESR